MAVRKAYAPLVTNPAEKLDASTCRFIRIYASKWKAKTMFQVLLQYRAARYHDLFNFSQQVHLFNQQAVCALQRFNNNIGLDLVDRHAKPQGWLGEIKPSVLKLPFRLIDIPYFDTSYMCDPLSNPGVALDKDEDWDAPFQWRDNVSSKITNTLQETKIAISKPYSANIKSHSSMHRPTEPLINLPYSRDPDEPIRRLSTMSMEQPEPNHGRNLFRNNNPPPPPMSNYSTQSYGFNQTSTTARHSYNPMHSYSNTNYNNQRNQQNSTFPPKDHEYNGTGNRMNPIAELRTIGRKNTPESGNEDDPPFNFQAMLRKTNVNRDSMKRNVETLRNLSFKNRKGFSQENLVYDSRQNSLRKNRSVDSLDQRQRQKLELAPGIYMEGMVADL